MAVLQLHGVSVAWSALVPVFEDVSLLLDRGLYGLVGANGAGKTTLLALLAGELEPHEGRVQRRPREAVVVYCPQRVEERGTDVEALAARTDALGAKLRGRLSLEPEELERWPTLSPGERKRWQIAAALGGDPDVLLLDEPTNHLDVEARQSLIEAVASFSGVGVIVSHDRALLDALTRATLRVHAGKVSLYEGSYSVARPHWQHERAREEAKHGAAQHELRQAEQRLTAARTLHTAASQAVNTRARSKGKYDHDASSMGASVVTAWAEGKAGRLVGRARADVERAREAIPSIERDVTLGGKVFAAYERAPNSLLFHLDQAELRAGDQVILREVRLSIGREERLRIEGVNGSGKTSLLEALVGSQAKRERIFYLPQELEPEALQGVMQRLTESTTEARGRLLSIFAALGSDPARIVHGTSSGFSPGEARKLVLAEALARQAWALVLDEPTNHLDLPSIERLETALDGYPGCVLLVTHDDAFARRVTNRSLRLRDERID